MLHRELPSPASGPTCSQQIASLHLHLPRDCLRRSAARRATTTPIIEAFLSTASAVPTQRLQVNGYPRRRGIKFIASQRVWRGVAWSKPYSMGQKLPAPQSHSKSATESLGGFKPRRPVISARIPVHQGVRRLQVYLAATLSVIVLVEAGLIVMVRIVVRCSAQPVAATTGVQ